MFATDRPSAHNSAIQTKSADNYSDWLFPANVSGLQRLLIAGMASVEDPAAQGPPRAMLESARVMRSEALHSDSSDDDDEQNDAVIVQPSFDDHGANGKGSEASDKSNSDWQCRSPHQDGKDESVESRSPSSPTAEGQAKKERQEAHTRNLSALFDATSISDEIIGPEQSVALEDDMDGRKHRRIFSGGASNPNLAHRRLNSNGNVAQVKRRGPNHHREPSEGLDILSAAANATKEELAAVAARQVTTEPEWDRQPQHPRSSLGQVSSSSSTYAQPSPHPPPYQYGDVPPHPSRGHPMEPPPHRYQRGPYHAGPPGYPPYSPEGPPPPGYHHYPPPPPHGGSYYSHPYSTHPHGPPVYPPHYPHRPSEYYSQKHNDYNSHRPPRHHPDMGAYEYEREPPVHGREWGANPPVAKPLDGNPESHNPAAPTAPKASEAGKDTVGMDRPSPRNSLSSTERAHPPVPSEVGHHRKMSSFSSIGTMFGASMFPGSSGSGPESDDAKGKKHHRVTSSSVSFLNGLDVGLDDANFLKNLQASNNSATSAFRSSPTLLTNNSGASAEVPEPRASPPLPPIPIAQENRPSPPDVQPAAVSSTKLAPGGASKRVRRKCTTPGCQNRVVQGGLCISHGAKRKTCKHPGCTKNVKKAGLCSTHGPARKRCEFPDCSKVAVQGGRCIAHGAKKKLCSVEECTKQAILGGMCKKHHDQTKLLEGADSELFCRPAPKSSHKPTHTRGLSIFQEMSADTVSSILNDSSTSKF